MKPRDFRRIALAFDGVVEGAHMGHPDFRLGGRIFASLNAEETRGMVILRPEDQEAFVREYPEMFSPASGAWGRQGCTRVHLDAADEERAGEALTLAVRLAREKGPTRSAGTKPRTTATRGAAGRTARKPAAKSSSRRRSRA